MNPTAGMLKMHFRDKWLWLYTPWVILLSSFLVNVIVASFIQEPIYTGGLVSIFIYMLITGILILVQTFPFALGLSQRRTDYFIGTSLMAIITSATYSILLYLLAIIESKLTGGWGLELHYFHLPFLNDGNAMEQLWMYFVLFLNMFFLGLMISSIFRRFGRSGLFIFSGVTFILCSLGVLLMTYNQWWVDLFNWFAGYTAFELALWSMPLTVVYALLSFLMLRRATV
ncbi:MULTISPECIES: hypothetical protein [Paenibacillus]|uniref:Uncharacterized protein n=1 Tax=Paenibacillus odorifer TaxID=189426 RepID=A0A1R0XDY6_9BACL|nr:MULTISPECIES: hypothetical protein [Paenibacillus]ETT45374.1 hypothetical protein C171_31796 [Paenibacillus sp. FSL H8-237]MEC0130904.1 hypothetical protein [Paenibacillus odorifer]MEC0221107.1 hypothetical protein [Paenibacillus odorifer]OMD01818.1 hypothetical protein BJP49_27065 [Paenibacillus odorifer]OMD33256.1 hypothetical protein BJP51_12940 [Paenibacillus odorifer]